MALVSGSVEGTGQGNFRFRCIACGELSHRASQDFRCESCGDLLEITYPAWKEARPDPGALKSAWSERRRSMRAADLSGVWSGCGIPLGGVRLDW